mgnify:CR=1 FL=1
MLPESVSNRCEGKVLSDFSLKTVVLGHGRRSPDKDPSVLFGRTNRSNFCCTSPVMVMSPYEHQINQTNKIGY